VESFLLSDTERSGEQTSLSPRVGIEAEVVPNFLAVRLGSYYEPSRFVRSGRPHLTGGADVNAIELWWEWKVGVSVDLAEEYVNVGLGVGFWH
jgi:hypothetical protein